MTYNLDEFRHVILPVVVDVLLVGDFNIPNITAVRRFFTRVHFLLHAAVKRLQIFSKL